CILPMLLVVIQPECRVDTYEHEQQFGRPPTKTRKMRTLFGFLAHCLTPAALAMFNIVRSRIPVNGVKAELQRKHQLGRVGIISGFDALTPRRQDCLHKRNGGDRFRLAAVPPSLPKIGTRYCCIASCSSFLAFIMS